MYSKIIFGVIIYIYLSTELAFGQENGTGTTFDFSFFFYSTIFLILFFVSLYKLTRPRPENLSEKMKCPNCKEEPFKVFKWSAKISIVKYLKGYIICVSCGYLLKRHYSKLTWGSLFVFVSSYFLIFIPLLPPLFNPENKIFSQEIYLYLFMGVGGVGFLAFIIGALSTTLTTRFLKVEE